MFGRWYCYLFLRLQIQFQVKDSGADVFSSHFHINRFHDNASVWSF